ncbi:MAG TPA: hypothetical protein VKE41_15095 [Roseiflexaceae bacterium]|nr:hypothetical protein [Roseiflexaceae bacterium]
MAAPAIPAVVDLTNNQLYWLAGLIEGEGSFVAGTPSHPRRAVVAITMTDYDIVKRVSDTLGVKINKVKPASDRHKQAYRVGLDGGRAVCLMNLLYPYMGKRRRASIERAKASYRPAYTRPHGTYSVIDDELPESERYWLSGYLEGEGYFALEKHVKPFATYFRPLVALNSTDQDVVVYVQCLLHNRYAVNVTVSAINPRYPAAKTAYCLRVRGCKAITIMQDVYPLMGHRRQAKIAEILASQN